MLLTAARSTGIQQSGSAWKTAGSLFCINYYLSRREIVKKRRFPKWQERKNIWDELEVGFEKKSQEMAVRPDDAGYAAGIGRLRRQ